MELMKIPSTGGNNEGKTRVLMELMKTPITDGTNEDKTEYWWS